ncbi:hypothetical protein NM208_g2747 [Fusarium decemcellulare]|uniref:Uncharacterized protein n=1 Tax=Fusarium decemcellulare TaxID=57161 RepID=A0ACC1SRW4_9HYPO|nr:hypothetical protein NM208_g2747 [Fusarium decemcellulare]
MSSLPPTPPSKDPWEEVDFRFRTNGTACEWGEAYHPGGYHPIHLGDVVQNRCRIIRKLGWGQFSTVWLAIDTQLDRYVSLKITVAVESGNVSKEVTLYRSRLQPGSTYLVTLYDAVREMGPNGEHDGLIFETMGPNLATLLQKWPDFQIGQPWERRFTKEFAKRSLLDTIRTLHFLHERGVVHGDVHLGNILTCIRQPKASPASESELQQPTSDAQPLKRRDGKKDLWAPSYLLEGRPMEYSVSYDLDPLVKLADLGGAFADEQPISATAAVTPVALRAPETILGENLDKGIDIWSFGCLVFEMIVGRSLFVGVQPLEGKSYDEISNDEHLIQLWEVIGPLPKPLLSKWRRADQYFSPDGERLDADSDGEGPGSEDGSIGEARDRNVELGPDLEIDGGSSSSTRSSDSLSLASPGNFLSLEDQFNVEKPSDIDEAEGTNILHLLRWIFQYDPAHRPSTKDIISHAWFSS